MTMRSDSRHWNAILGRGFVGGLVAALVMGAFAMIAGATYLASGFFTPLYHIASVFIGPDAMTASMEQAQAGNVFFFDLIPAMAGLGIHLAVGGGFGLIFGFLVGALRVRGIAAVLLGIVYGLGVFSLMSYIVLPWVAGAIGGGEAIAEMGDMVGMGTFAIEHAIFGFVLGLWPIYRPHATATAMRPASSEPLGNRAP